MLVFYSVIWYCTTCLTLIHVLIWDCMNEPVLFCDQLNFSHPNSCSMTEAGLQRPQNLMTDSLLLSKRIVYRIQIHVFYLVIFLFQKDFSSFASFCFITVFRNMINIYSNFQYSSIKLSKFFLNWWTFDFDRI